MLGDPPVVPRLSFIFEVEEFLVIHFDLRLVTPFGLLAPVDDSGLFSSVGETIIGIVWNSPYLPGLPQFHFLSFSTSDKEIMPFSKVFLFFTS